MPDCFHPENGIATSLYGVGRLTWHKLASISFIKVSAILLSAVYIENDNPYFPRLENEIATFETAIKNWKLQPTPRERLGK